MSGCPGLHCDGCGGHGGGPGVAIAVLVVVAVAAGASAVRTAMPVIRTALEVAGIAVASAAGLAAVIGVSFAAARVHRAVRAARPRPVPYRVEVVTVVPSRAAGRPAGGPAALEAPRSAPAAWPLAAVEVERDAC